MNTPALALSSTHFFLTSCNKLRDVGLAVFLAGICISLATDECVAQGWSYFGPDSTNWREVIQLDASFPPGNAPRVAAATSRGIAKHFGQRWDYSLPNQPHYPGGDEIGFRHVRFSPWNDSVAFVGYAYGIANELCVGFAKINNVDDPYWFYTEAAGSNCVCGGDWSFAFPPWDTAKAYALVCQELHTSSDNGVTWLSNYDSLYGSRYFLTANASLSGLLYLGGSPPSQSIAGVYASTNEGSTWNRIHTFATQYRKADFIPTGDTLILATSISTSLADSTCGIFRSTDAGGSWEQVLSGVNVEALTDNDTAPLYAASRLGVYRSLDEGVTWHLYNNTLPSLNLVDIAKDPYSDTIYVATADLGVYKVFSQVVGVKEFDQVPATFSLDQNYPNPFNSWTVIKYQIAERSKVTLKVFDLLGCEVATITEGDLAPGTFEARFDASHLASGVYFYRLEAGSFVNTKKQLLLK